MALKMGCYFCYNPRLRLLGSICDVLEELVGLTADSVSIAGRLVFSRPFEIIALISSMAIFRSLLQLPLYEQAHDNQCDSHPRPPVSLPFPRPARYAPILFLHQILPSTRAFQ